MSLSHPCSSNGAEWRYNRHMPSPRRVVGGLSLPEVSRARAAQLVWCGTLNHGHGFKPMKGGGGFFLSFLLTILLYIESSINYFKLNSIS